MAFDIEGARKEGYSESEIAEYLSSQNKFDINDARKEGYSDTDIINHLSAPSTSQKQQPLSWGKAIEEAIVNIPSSGVEFVKNIAQPFIHPVNTVNSLRDITFGGVNKIIPGAGVEGQEEKFDAITQFFVDRYGSLEGFKKALAKDPVGIIADASTVLTAGGTLAARTPGIVGKAGNITANVGKSIEPLTLAGKAIAPVVKGGGNVLAGTLGFTTGSGRESIKQALRGSKDFTDAMRGRISQEQILGTAKEGLQAIRDERAINYQTKLSELKNSQAEINIKPVKDKMAQLELAFGVKRKNIINQETGQMESKLDFSRSSLDDAGQKDVEKVIRLVEDWGSQSGDFTPIGMDILKRRLDDIYSQSSNSRKFVTSLKNEVKNSIIKQVPEYNAMVSGYEKLSNDIREIEYSLSLGKKASTDTGIRKLMTTLKDNYDFRKTILDKIDEYIKANNGGDIKSQIAGANMSSPIPSGIMGKSIDVAALGAVLFGSNPSALLAMTTASPRLIGELTNFLGKSLQLKRKTDAIFKVPVRQGAFQVGRTSNIPQMTD